jgi:hypothetical protein
MKWSSAQPSLNEEGPLNPPHEESTKLNSSPPPENMTARVNSCYQKQVQATATQPRSEVIATSEAYQTCSQSRDQILKDLSTTAPWDLDRRSTSYDMQQTLLNLCGRRNNKHKIYTSRTGLITCCYQNQPHPQTRLLKISVQPHPSIKIANPLSYDIQQNNTLPFSEET